MNIKDKLRWKQVDHSERLYINEIHVGNVWYNATTSREDKAYIYVGNSLLPGSAQKRSIHGTTPEEVKTLVESLVIAWFEEILK